MYPNFEKFTLMKQIETTTSDSTDDNTVLAVSGNRKELIQAIATQLQIIESLISGNRVVNLDEAIAYYKSILAACASGAMAQSQSVRDCYRAATCDEHNESGYCAVCGGKI